MKPATKRFTTLTALALTSVLLLGACGNNKKEATLTSSSSKVSQKVKSTKPSSKEKAKKSEQKTKSSSSEEVSKATSGEKDSQPSAGNVAGSAQQEVAPKQIPSEETAGVNQGTTTEQPAAFSGTNTSYHSS